MEEKEYYLSLDLLRIGLVLLMALVLLGIPIIGGNYIAVGLNFAPGCLFAIYGYTALRDGVDYRAKIKKTTMAFLIMLAAYGLLTLVYLKVLSSAAGVPFASYIKPLIRKRTIFEFVVMNVWPVQMGSSIWMVQAAAYALPILWFLDEKLHLLKYSFSLSMFFFVIAFLVGDGAGLWNFHLFGYAYIPGNFITRALPYMLLGRAIWVHQEKMEDVEPLTLWVMFFSGFALCFCELYGLGLLDKLVYAGHLLGHTMTTFAAIELTIRANRSEVKFTNFIHKVLFYLYNPVIEGIVLLMWLSAMRNA